MKSILVLLLLAFALTGMARSDTAAVSQPPPTSTLPVLLPVSLYEITERPPESGFEYALRESDWGVNDWSTIRLIVQCESNFDRLAVGRAGEAGALQIHPIHDLAHQFNLWTYEGSLAAAAVVHEEQGFGAWSCFGGAE